MVVFCTFCLMLWFLILKERKINKLKEFKNKQRTQVAEHIKNELESAHKTFQFRRPKDWQNNVKYQHCTRYFSQFGIKMHDEI